MHRKKNQKRLILCCAILLALLLVLLAILLIFRENPDSGEEDESIQICKLNTSDVQKITYEYQGETVILSRENGMWTIAGEDQFPLNQALIISTSQNCMTYRCARLTFTKKIAEQCTDLATFGLDQPVLTLTFVTKENSEEVTRTLTVGRQYATFGYYCMLSGDPALYMVDEDFVKTFSYTKDDLANRDFLPSVKVENVVDYTFQRGDQSFCISSRAGVNEIFSRLSELNFQTFADYYATEEELETYFPADEMQTLTIRYFKSEGNAKEIPPTVASFEIYFGKTAQGGVYFRIWYKNAVYYTAEENVTALADLAQTHHAQVSFPVPEEIKQITEFVYVKGENTLTVNSEAGLTAVLNYVKTFALDRLHVSNASGDALKEAFPETSSFFVLRYADPEEGEASTHPFPKVFVLEFGKLQGEDVLCRVWYENEIYLVEQDFLSSLEDLMETHKYTEKKEEANS